MSKCDICDMHGNVSAIFPDGETVTKRCKCRKMINCFSPIKMKFNGIIATEENKKEFSFKKRYCVDVEDLIYKNKIYDPLILKNYSFQIKEIWYEFDENIANTYTIESLLEGFSCGSKDIAFTSEAECKKFCDWINAKILEKENTI